MGFMLKGTRINLPWNDAYEQQIFKYSEETYKYSGEELLHEMHKQVIEAHWINLALYRSLAKRLAWVIGLQFVALAYLLYRLT
jgi:hypothetical protein